MDEQSQNPPPGSGKQGSSSQPLRSSLQRGNPINRSVMWGGNKHKQGSVTSIVTSTLDREERKLEQQLETLESTGVSSRTGMGFESNENFFMSDVNVDTGDLEAELAMAEEAYNHTGSYDDMQNELQLIVESTRDISETHDEDSRDFLPAPEDAALPESHKASSLTTSVRPREEEPAISGNENLEETRDNKYEEREQTPDEATSDSKANDDTKIVSPDSKAKYSAEEEDIENCHSEETFTTVYSDENEPLLASSAGSTRGVVDVKGNVPPKKSGGSDNNVVRVLTIGSCALGFAVVGWVVVVVGASSDMQIGFGLGLSVGLMSAATAYCLRK